MAAKQGHFESAGRGQLAIAPADETSDIYILTLSKLVRYYGAPIKL